MIMIRAPTTRRFPTLLLPQTRSRHYYSYLQKSYCSRYLRRRRRRRRRSFSTASAAASNNSHTNTTNNNKRFWLDDDNGLLYDDTSHNNKDNKKPIYQVIIGLEVHAQLDIPTKLFSSAPSSSSMSSSSSTITTKPNSNIHPYDVAVPGYLPLLSLEAVRKAIIAASAFNCVLPSTSRFERKHYTYADLPHGYQITQQRWPLAMNGNIVFSTSATDSTKKKKTKGNSSKLDHHLNSCCIERIQLEQDTAKTIAVDNESRVDFDRAGCALIEIVTSPDLRSPKQAAALVKHIRNLLQHLGVCKGRMQDGHLRVDANINLQRLNNDGHEDGEPSSSWRTPRVEVKNLNSIQQVAAATTYEALRQASVFDIDTMMNGDTINKKDFPEETRTWNATTSSTSLIRKKDQEDDYRFLPEPDLPPLILHVFLSQYGGHTSLDDFLADNMPERPEVIVERLQKSYGYSDSQASVLAQHNDPSAIRLLEDILKLLLLDDEGKDLGQKQKQQYAKLAYNLLVNELFALVKECAGDDQEPSLDEHNTVTAEQLSVLVQMLVEGSISKTQSKKLLQLLFREYDAGDDPRSVASECNLTLLSDPIQLQEVCRRVVLDENPAELAKYKRGGKFATKMRKFFTGQAMTITNYNAHPERLQEALSEVLEEIEQEEVSS